MEHCDVLYANDQDSMKNKLNLFHVCWRKHLVCFCLYDVTVWQRQVESEETPGCRAAD